MASQTRWQRALVEGTVIVASILLAFGIQAWWDGRQEAVQEQRLLAALEAEFEENGELLGEARALYEQKYVEGLHLLDILDGSSVATDEEFAELVRSFLANRTFHLETGAHDGLVAAGELDLIRDEDLRHQLAAWPSFVAEWAEEEQAVFAFVRDRILVHLGDRLPVRHVHRPVPAFLDGESPPPIPQVPLAVDGFRALRGDLTFENDVFLRASGLWFAMRDGETLRAQLAEILERIRANRSD